mmetsp:Transcript_37864/g.36284  ORF Transcript_37864/g.36284 Transcript_37864/m.36284 type:complete len:200 (-) Transcript_37864:192-791(-)
MASLEEDTLSDIIYHMEQKFYTKDSIILKQGESITNAYIILDGEVEVMTRTGWTESTLENLFKMCSFGCYASISNKDNSYSSFKFVARSNCSLLLLPKHVLDLKRNTHQKLDQNLAITEKYIQENGLPMCDFLFYRGDSGKKKNCKLILKRAVHRLGILNKKNTEKMGEALNDIMNNLKEQKISDKVRQDEKNKQLKIS